MRGIICPPHYAESAWEILCEGPPFTIPRARELLRNLQESWRRTALHEYADDLYELFLQLHERFSREDLLGLAHYFVPTGKRGRIYLALRCDRGRVPVKVRVELFMRWLLENTEPARRTP